ncbi:helix-turn-helix transcriptional regulator [Salinicola halophyticus]|uniref:helix-turn-helix transcriptional regulator n=1 Tax=Salinicola halophyticus TaxID=1808881 RepID=UPI000DA24543|nr:helix-turn-helix transcriptional regulator [Salinicola halophyticus]
MSSSASNAPSLGEFLRTRRAAVTPELAGLPPGRRRRTPGLRREEVATRASMGTAWYTALEQGRNVQPSDQALACLARALLMTETEREHLYALAGRPAPPRAIDNGSTINPILQRLLDRMEPDPAYVMDAYWEVIAWNQAAAQLFDIERTGDKHPRNKLWWVFTQKRIETHEADWLRSARTLVSIFRSQATRYAGDPRMRQLIDDLLEASDVFRELWAEQDVLDLGSGRKSMQLPDGSNREFDYLPLRIPDLPGACLMIYLGVE